MIKDAGAKRLRKDKSSMQGVITMRT